VQSNAVKDLFPKELTTEMLQRIPSEGSGCCFCSMRAFSPALSRVFAGLPREKVLEQMRSYQKFDADGHGRV
jgi:hypothetical protein